MTALPTKAAHKPERLRSSNLSGCSCAQDSQLHLPLWLIQALRFGVVGLSNTLVDAMFYLALTRGPAFFYGTGHGDLYPALAKALSYTAGVVNSFYWNKNWTFRSHARRTGWKSFLPFVLVNLVGVLVNAGSMHFCLGLLGLNEALAFVGATGITLAWNFLVSKFIVFRNA